MIGALVWIAKALAVCVIGVFALYGVGVYITGEC